MRENIWSCFHKLRLGDISKMWKDFCKSNGVTLSPLVYQHINQKLYSDLIKSRFSKKPSESTVDIPELTTDEENVIRYIAGYVPFKLLKRYEQSVCEESEEFIECLSSMAVNGEESTLMEYTRKWCMLVDRGGLFEVNDTAYSLFLVIELKVRKQLIIIFNGGSTLGKEDRRQTITRAVAGDEDVQFYWTLLSVDITDEIKATMLLSEMIGLWVTIRGFSIAKAWLEKYLPKKIGKTKGLRKELKKTFG